MSTATRWERAGLLERLTSSTAFTVLLFLASIVLAPTVLIGLVALVTLLPASSVLPEVRPLLLLAVGGAIGYIGLFRARSTSASAAGYRATLACLAIGIVTAAAVAGIIVDAAGLDDATSLAALVPAIPILAAFGRIARLRRLRAAAEGRVPDSLPLIFLAVALGEALCAIAIGVRLALGG